MQRTTTTTQTTNNNTGRVILAAFLLATMICNPAFAQVAKVNSTMALVESILNGVAITAFTVTIMWTGFKMAFQHAKWTEVSNIVIGGIFIGGASALASLLVS